MSSSPPHRILIVAGEVSGDQHAAGLVRDLRAIRGDLEFYGIGGDALRGEGVDIWVDAREMALVGLTEVVAHLPFLRRVFKRLETQLATDPPEVLLLVDYPGFNLRLAEAAHSRGIPVFYYISPQVWAWHRSRIGRMARVLDLLMVIFPFEVDVFKETGLETVFVGHPLVESIQRTLAQPPIDLPWPPGGRRVALLPGSRKQEIQYVLPPMLETARELRRRDPSVAFLIPAASPEIAQPIHDQLAALPAEDRTAIAVVPGQLREVVRQAQAAMVCSGTATVEVALIQCPMIVVYRTSWLTYWIGRWLVSVPWLGMVNLIANRTLCPEFIQHAAEASAMADAIESLLGDTSARQDQLAGFEQIAAALQRGDGVPSAGAVVAAALDRLRKDNA